MYILGGASPTSIRVEPGLTWDELGDDCKDSGHRGIGRCIIHRFRGHTSGTDWRGNGGSTGLAAAVSEPSGNGVDSQSAGELEGGGEQRGGVQNHMPPRPLSLGVLGQ